MEEKATVEEIKTLLKMISSGYKIPQILYDTVMDVCKREIEDKDMPVIVKRDPNIHGRRIQGAYAKMDNLIAIN